MANSDYYEILGVDESADPDSIKDSYRKLALRYHPDRNCGDTGAAERMKAINEAYAVLSDPLKRREYDVMKDQYGSSASSHFRHSYSEQDIFSGSDINGIFEELSRSFGLRGFDELFREAEHSGTRTFQFHRTGLSGRGYVFTKGFGNNTGQRTHRRQQQLPRKGILGKLANYAFKKMSNIEIPERGKDIVDIIRLTPRQAWTGGPLEYTHWRRDKKIVVKVPSGIRKGQKIRIAGQGEVGNNGAGAGDLYLKVHIKRPLLQEIGTLVSKFIPR